MKYILILFLLYSTSLCAQEEEELGDSLEIPQKQKINAGLSWGIGGANVFLIPAIEVSSGRNNLSIAYTKLVYGAGYTRELFYFKPSNKKWSVIGSIYYTLDWGIQTFQSRRMIDYFTGQKGISPTRILSILGGIKYQFGSRFFTQFQVGRYWINGGTEGEFDAQISIGFNFRKTFKQ
jgi:hypothetical protein